MQSYAADASIGLHMVVILGTFVYNLLYKHTMHIDNDASFPLVEERLQANKTN